MKKLDWTYIFPLMFALLFFAFGLYVYDTQKKLDQPNNGYELQYEQKIKKYQDTIMLERQKRIKLEEQNKAQDSSIKILKQDYEKIYQNYTNYRHRIKGVDADSSIKFSAKWLSEIED